MLTLLAAGETAWAAASLRTPHVELHLEAEPTPVGPGKTLWVALRFDLVPHWHVYWRNPGDSGEAPRVQWQLPDGWRAGEIHWPVPDRIPVGPLVNLGYEGSVTLLVPIQVATEPPAGDSVRIAAQATWLVCREECIPESGNLAPRTSAVGRERVRRTRSPPGGSRQRAADCRWVSRIGPLRGG